MSKILKSKLVVTDAAIESNTTKRTLKLGAESNFNYADAVKHSVISGFNILPNLNPLVSDTETWPNGAGYVAYGLDIFPDFTGNTNYRPWHNAHDTWLGFGRALGYGVIDGTNTTLVGTTVFNRNVFKYWDSVTAVGKGIHMGLTVGAHIPNPDVPFYPISNPSFNMRNLVGDIVAMGAELWFGDMHSAILLGNSIKRYKYAFNSIVIGNGVQNYPDATVTQEQLDNNSLDNDVIIGNGLWKNPNRYATTHNLIIGCQTAPGSGGWSSTYIPLIEGNFKDKWLRVNGKLSNNDERALYQPAAIYNQSGSTSTALALSQTPAGSAGTVTFDAATGILTFNNAPAGRYVLATNVPAGNYFFTAFNSGMSRTYNIRILNYSYNNAVLGFNYRDMLAVSDGTSATNEFAFELTGVTTGTIECALKQVDSNNVIKSIDKLYDSDGALTNELRLAKAAKNTISYGLNSLTRYFAGNNNAIFGNNNLTISGNNTSNAVIGTNNAKLAQASHKLVAHGTNNLNKLLNVSKITVIGSDNLNNATDIEWSFIVGDGCLPVFVGGPNGGSTYNSNIFAFGIGLAGNLISGQNAILMGRATGYGATTINNSIAIVAKNAAANTFGTSTPDNAIVISGNATTGFGSNTTTIGNAATVATYLYGDLYKTKSINFTLKTSITASENMLVPTIDGSSLLWYNNSKVSMKLIGETASQTTVLNEKLALHRAKLKSYTKAERNALTAAETGEMIWQTDAGNSGIRVFDGTNWLAVQTLVD
jgi:hypothetical protein